MTADQQALVHPFRGETGVMPDADVGARRVQSAWNRTDFFTPHSTSQYWTRGLEHAPREIAQLTRGAIEVIEHPTTPATDPDVEAALMWMFDYEGRRGFTFDAPGEGEPYLPVDAWLVRRWMAAGTPFALQVLAAFPRYEIHPSCQGAAPTRWLRLDGSRAGNPRTVHPAAASHREEPRPCGRRQGGCTHTRDGATVHARRDLVRVPDEPFWKRDLEDAQPTKKSKAPKLDPATWALVTTRIDEVSLSQILSSMARDGQRMYQCSDAARYCYTLVHRFGDGAMRHLLAFLARVKDQWYAKEQFASALALIDAPEARAFFEANLKHRSNLGAIARAYVER